MLGKSCLTGLIKTYRKVHHKSFVNYKNGKNRLQHTKVLSYNKNKQFISPLEVTPTNVNKSDSVAIARCETKQLYRNKLNTQCHTTDI